MWWWNYHSLQVVLYERDSESRKEESQHAYIGSLT
jgi:hypothetical protein